MASYTTNKKILTGSKYLLAYLIITVTGPNTAGESTVKVDVYAGRDDSSSSAVSWGGDSDNDYAGNRITTTVNGHVFKDYINSAATGLKYPTSLKGTHTINIAHDASGKLNLNIILDVRCKNGSYYLANYNVGNSEPGFKTFLNSLPQVSRASSITATSSTIGTANGFNLKLNRNSAGNIVYDVVTWYAAGQSGTIQSNLSGTMTTESIPFTLSETTARPMIEATPNSNYFLIEFRTSTYSDTSHSALLGTNSISVSAFIPDYGSRISISALTAEGTAQIKSMNLQYFLSNISTINSTITATSLYNATIASCTIEVEGRSYSANKSGSNWIATMSNPILNTATSLNYNVTVIDSRGFSKTQNISTGKAVNSYTPPRLDNVMTLRCDSDRSEYYQGAYVLLYFNAVIDKLLDASGADINKADYQLHWSSTNLVTVEPHDDELKQYDDLHPHGWNATTDETALLFKLNPDKPEEVESFTDYDITLTLSDKLSSISVTTHSTTVDRLIHFHKDGQHIAFSKQCEAEPVAAVEFGKEIMLDKGYIPAPIGTDNLNNATYPGIFTCKGNETNKPSNISTTFSLEVRQIATNQYIQTAEWLTSSGKQVYTRRYYSNAWSTWTNSETDVSTIVQQVANTMYPVGAIYITTSNAGNPNNIFTWQTWELIEGKFLLGSSSTHALNDIGGAESYHYNKTVSVAAHKHLSPAGQAGTIMGIVNVWGTDPGGSGKPYVSITSQYHDNSLGSNINLAYTSSAGAQNIDISDTIDTMPPYQVVNIWQRIM